MTLFFNSREDSYKRLGQKKAPKYVSWGRENRSQLIRIPAAEDEYRRIELRSPDPAANPYIAFALIIWASLYGMRSNEEVAEPADINIYKADGDSISGLDKLPESIEEAKRAAQDDDFIKKHIPKAILDIYCAE